MNQIYRDLVQSRVRSAIDAAKSMGPITHQGLKGQLREMLIRDLFRPLFPSDIGMGTGQIVTADDRVSRQTDVVIYDRRILPAVLYENTTGVFPLEAVTGTIEVKSVLTAGELKRAVEAAKELASMQYLSGLRDPTTGLVAQHAVTRIAPAVFALESDLAQEGKSEFQRLRELGGAGEDGLRALCVVGRGYWFAAGSNWLKAPETGEFSEVLAFMASYSDGLPHIAATRFRPPLAEYLFNAEEMPVPHRDAIK